MRRAILLGFLALLSALPAQASNHGNWFNLRNESGKPITEVWLSSHGAEKWQKYTPTLDGFSGASLAISDNGISPTDVYDLTLTLDAGGSPAKFLEGFNPLLGDELVVHFQDGMPWIEIR
jgi:hypothetical protein